MKITTKSTPGDQILFGQGDKNSPAINENYSKNKPANVTPNENRKSHSFTGPEFLNRFKKF